MSQVIQDPDRWRAALYIRLSREDDGEGESESVSNQRSLLTEFIESQGIAHSREYVDGTVIIGLNCRRAAGRFTDRPSPGAR